MRIKVLEVEYSERFEVELESLIKKGWVPKFETFKVQKNWFFILLTKFKKKKKEVRELK